MIFNQIFCSDGMIFNHYKMSYCSNSFLPIFSHFTSYVHFRTKGYSFHSAAAAAADVPYLKYPFVNTRKVV